MLNIKLYFEDNHSFKGAIEGFPYLESFAKTLMWLYSDEADGPHDQYYCLRGVVKMYQLVNVIVLLVSHAKGELGEATVSEYISDMKNSEGKEWHGYQYNIITEYINKKGEKGLSVKWTTHEFILSILWGGYIYCKALTSLGEKKWSHAQDVMYKVLKDESRLEDSAFNKHWLIKHTDEMVNNMLHDIEERKKREVEKKASKQAVPDNNQQQEEPQQRAEESDEQLRNELNQIKKDYEDTLVELLKPAFYNIDDDARDFLKRIRGLDSWGVVAVARQFVKDNKIIPRHKKSFIWKILKAAKLYDKTEQNWAQQMDIKE